MKVYNQNQKDENKKGFLPFFSRMFSNASRTTEGLGAGAGKVAGGIGKASFLSSLFATKAGVVGVLLGAATIAAGIGLIYNYISPSSGKIYTPGLFSDAYYQEAQQQANAERTTNSVIPPDSTLSKFAEAAQKELAGEPEKNTAKTSSDSDAETSQQSAPAPEVNIPTIQNQNQPEIGKLQAQLGFNNASGRASNSSASAPRLQTSGGLWSEMGKQFTPLGNSSAKLQSAGKASNMNKGLSARLIASPKYHVPNINKKGAFGQAKFAGNVGRTAAYQPSDAGARTTAEQAFSGQTAGSGDIAVPIGGTGLGGAGLSAGNKLKANDPSLNVNEYTPPTPQKKTDTPWKALVDRALYAMLAAVTFIYLARLFAKFGKTNPIWFKVAYVFSALAIAAASIVIASGWQLSSKYGQKMMGLLYIGVGTILVIQAIMALIDIHGMSKSVNIPKNNLWSGDGPVQMA